jgi:hypothetical protein
MTDIRETLEAKSDQLNAVDIMGFEPVIKITKVEVKKGEQPVSIYFEGDNNRPWKPSKGMRRILAAAWGFDSDKWKGKKAKIFFEPSVMYAGKEIGGIRVKALSDIPEEGITCALTISRQKREPYKIELLVVESNPYPDKEFKEKFPAMEEQMKLGNMSLQQVIAHCEKTGTLTKKQKAELEKVAPVEITDEEDKEVF